MSDPFTLSEHDKAQGLWLRLREHLMDRLLDARVRNDAMQSDYETASLRGEIRTLKALIRLGDDRPAMLTDEDQPPD